MARRPRPAAPAIPPRPAPPPAKPSPRLTAVVAALTVVVVGSVGWWVVYPEWTAHRSLARAKVDLDAHDLPAAEASLRRVLAARPDHPEAAYLLAQLYRRTERYADARKQLAEAARLGWVLESVELERLLLTVLESGPTGPAEAKLRLYVDTSHPDDRTILDGLTQSYLDSHFLTEALGLLDKWVERYPDDGYARFRRGEVREAMLQGEAAVADYRAALDRNPDHPSARRRLAGILLGARKELEEAVRLYEEQRRRFPNDAEATAGLAETLAVLGRSDDALRLADEALALNRALPQAMAVKAGLVRGTDPRAAFDLLQKVVAARPDDTLATLTLSQLAGQLGRPDDAARYLERHKLLEAEQKRLDQLAETVRQRPHDPDVRVQIGRAKVAVGRPQDAPGGTRVRREDPNHAPTHEALAEYYAGRAPLLAAQHEAAAQRLRAVKK